MHCDPNHKTICLFSPHVSVWYSMIKHLQVCIEMWHMCSRTPIINPYACKPKYVRVCVWEYTWSSSLISQYSWRVSSCFHIGMFMCGLHTRTSIEGSLFYVRHNSHTQNTVIGVVFRGRYSKLAGWQRWSSCGKKAMKMVLGKNVWIVFRSGCTLTARMVQGHR